MRNPKYGIGQEMFLVKGKEFSLDKFTVGFFYAGVYVFGKNEKMWKLNRERWASALEVFQPHIVIEPKSMEEILPMYCCVAEIKDGDRYATVMWLGEFPTEKTIDSLLDIPREQIFKDWETKSIEINW